jgi:hypothetical protein
MLAKYEETRLRNKKIDQRYKDLKSTIRGEEEKYKMKTYDLLKEIEFLKELVKNQVQNTHEINRNKSQS